MYRSKRSAGVVFGATILASMMLGGSVLAQGAESRMSSSRRAATLE